MRRRRSGQTLPFLMIALTLTATLIARLIGTARTVHERVQLQTVADVTVLSACRLQARALNAAALLNQQIAGAAELSRLIIATGAALAACASLCGIGACACAESLAVYARQAPELLRRLRLVAAKMAQAQDRIVAAAPQIIMATTALLAAENRSVVSSLRWPGKGAEPTPPLHVQRGSPIVVVGSGKFPGLLRLNKHFDARQTLQLEVRRHLDGEEGASVLNGIARAKPLFSGTAGNGKALMQTDWDAALTAIDSTLLSLRYKEAANALLH